ncbi:MAG: hypothetical protein HY320_04505 [Armatimonadetes bacterium]|nr:hypothetical protein [Armatimonadota bacterium]
MARSQDFDSSVPLPPGLTIPAIRNSIDSIERELADFVDIYFDQMNVFSAIVGIFGTRALDRHSQYEKVRHIDLAQTRFPDLCRRGRRRGDGTIAPGDCLESKASKRPWSIQSHYDHEGWYIVWRYLVDPTQSIEPGKPVIIWRVDVVYLTRDDWKYEGSRAGKGGGGRTHTFGVKQPAMKLKDCAVYRRSDIQLAGGKPVSANGEG